jgi:hypothetical protein
VEVDEPEQGWKLVLEQVDRQQHGDSRPDECGYRNSIPRPATNTHRRLREVVQMID